MPIVGFDDFRPSTHDGDGDVTTRSDPLHLNSIAMSIFGRIPSRPFHTTTNTKPTLGFTYPDYAHAKTIRVNQASSHLARTICRTHEHPWIFEVYLQELMLLRYGVLDNHRVFSIEFRQ